MIDHQQSMDENAAAGEKIHDQKAKASNFNIMQTKTNQGEDTSSPKKIQLNNLS